MTSDGEVIQLGLIAFDISERKRLENALQKVTKKISLLNTVIFTDIQNKVFVQMGYLELARQITEDPRVKTYLEKEEAVVKEIQSSLSFARQFNDMGMNPPRWQNVQDVILFAVSHLELGGLVAGFFPGRDRDLCRFTSRTGLCHADREYHPPRKGSHGNPRRVH